MKRTRVNDHDERADNYYVYGFMIILEQYQLTDQEFNATLDQDARVDVYNQIDLFHSL